MHSALSLIALAAVALMGFANQRGSTCTVAAIDQIVSERRFDQLIALCQVSLWVGGGLVLLNALGLLPAVPVGYAAGAATIAGGALFGVGAFVNRACVLGSIARLGSGDWTYLAALPGFYLGTLTTSRLPRPARLTEGALVLRSPAWLVCVIAALLLVGLFVHAWRLRRSGGATLERIWTPYTATSVIGLTFLVATLILGRWTYIDFLSDLACGVTQRTAPKLMFSVALLLGAMVGGWTEKRLKWVKPDMISVARRLVGGALMGAGSALIPGGNDALVLVGMPLLWSYAWLAFASICITISVATVITRVAKVYTPTPP